MFYYRFYGLKIASEVALPVGVINHINLEEEKEIDLFFKIDKEKVLDLPFKEFDDYVNQEHHSKHTYVNCLTGKYEILADGKSVNFIRFTYCSSEQDIAACFVGIVLPYILQVRGIVPIHASGITHEEGAWGFMAGPGVGKSTIQIALMEKGMQFFTDDVMPLSIGEDVVLVHPGYAALKLDESSISIASQQTFINEDSLAEGATKQVYSLDETNACKDTKKLKGLFLLKPYNDSVGNIKVKQLQGHEKLIHILANTFTLGIINPETTIQYMSIFSSSIFKEIPVYSLEYPKEFSYLNEVCDQVIQTIKFGDLGGDHSVA